MARRQISTGSDFEKSAGYSRAVVLGDWCFVSGTTGYDYETMIMPEDILEQTSNCLSTIEAVLEEAGFSVSDIVRVRYYITDAGNAEKIFPVLGEAFGETRPAATMVVCDLIKPEMKIEIEATAMKN